MLPVAWASMLVPVDSRDWEVWWIETKHDKDDLAMLHRWGYRQPGRGDTARRLIPLYAPRFDGDGVPLLDTARRRVVAEKAQLICDRALERGGVLLVFDEFQHVVYSRISAGAGVEDVAKRGRGLDVGMMGEVQEPVAVPRLLFSQATHRAIFGLEHMPDIKIARELNPSYAAGWPRDTDSTVPDRHGFWLRSGPQAGDDNAWHYWRHVRAWHDAVHKEPAQRP